MSDPTIHVEPYVPESELERVVCDYQPCDDDSRWILRVDPVDPAGRIMLDACDLHLGVELGRQRARAVAELAGHPSALPPAPEAIVVVDGFATSRQTEAERAEDDAMMGFGVILETDGPRLRAITVHRSANLLIRDRGRSSGLTGGTYQVRSTLEVEHG